MVNTLMVPLPMVLTNMHWTPITGFETELQGVPSNSYALQYSSDFTNWVNLKTNVAVGGVTHFVDTNATTAGHRFYRAVAR
jgi:hypothetical protein